LTSALTYNGSIRQVYDPNVPAIIDLPVGGSFPKLIVYGACPGYSDGSGYSIIPAVYTDTPPANSVQTGWQAANPALVDGVAQITRTWQAVTPPPASFTPLEFLALFTDAEKAAIVSSTDPNVRLFLLMTSGARQITMNDTQTIAGINYLVSQGLLTSDRGTAILASPAPISSGTATTIANA
jgi:hypothetical protein